MSANLPVDFQEIIKEEGRCMYATHIYLFESSYDAIVSKISADLVVKDREVKIYNLREDDWTFDIVLIKSYYRNIPADLPIILNREANIFSNLCFASFYMFDGCFDLSILDDDWYICQIYGITAYKSLSKFAFAREERMSDKWHQEVRKMAASIYERFPELKSVS
ncbi:hypothetical protein [Chamaesiphon sp. VAR_48_metabat_403]|uniref:hypothetical protein n=1 Tax=Chamaesiphon sp. VAR_48_metabat_403 TaxID=2964700 RepID=UPI00286E92D8|nr:hypothetical protein [Chamaesiphon sp. VAR_48_metabat_403]